MHTRTWCDLNSQFNLPDMYYVYLIALYNQILNYLEPFSMQEPNSKRWYQSQKNVIFCLLVNEEEIIMTEKWKIIWWVYCWLAKYIFIVSGYIPETQ